MLKQIKQELLRLASGSGALSVVASSRWRRTRLLILCYHSVSLEHEDQWRPALYFRPEALARRFDLLDAMRCNVLPLAEAVERLAAGTLPERAVVLTFDDGMFDFWSIIWPMLKLRGWPATLYASTYYAEKRRPLFPLLCSYLLWKGRSRTLASGVLAGLEEPVELATVGERERVQRTLLASCEAHGLDAAARDEQADRLAAALELAPDFREKRLFGLMTPEEMAAASREGVDIQLHTHRHRTPRDRELFLREIRENRERLEEWTGRRLTHFCYPSGVVHPEFLPWLSESGVKTATTCVPGLSLASTERLLLPRLVDTSGLSDIEFEGWLAGASQWLPRRPVSFG